MSGSLLLIVAVWVVLLAPLLVRNQRPVRRTAPALNDTRVLHEGGAPLPGKRKLRPTPTLYHPDVDEPIEFVDEEPEYVLLEDGPDAGAGRRGRAGRAVRDAHDGIDTVDAIEVIQPESPVRRATSLDAGSSMTVAASSESARTQLACSQGSVETVDAEIYAEPDTAPADSAQGEQPAAEMNAEIVDGEVLTPAEARAEAARQLARRRTADAAEDEEAADAVTDVVDAGIGDAADADAVDNTADSADDAPTDGTADSAERDTDTANIPAADDDTPSRASRRQARYDEIPVAYLRGGDVRARGGVEDKVTTPAGPLEVLVAGDESDEPSADDIAYVNSRRGRGVYDPVASRALEQRRLRRRKQVLMVLALACVIAVTLGVVVGGSMWIAPVVTFAFTAFYLVVLRKQAIEEAKLRHRRMARMRRARLGVRNTEDDELGVPDRLQRPGAIILETDDVDPDFQHLDYVDGADYFAVAGKAPADEPHRQFRVV